MKSKALFFVMFIGVLSFAQKKNQVKVYYGFAEASYVPTKSLDGGGISANDFMINEIGVRYNRKIGKIFSVETGLNYFSSKVPYDIYYCPPRRLGEKERPDTGNDKIQLLTIPVSLLTEFWNYFYLNTGVLFDFQMNKSKKLDSQSGIGFVVGVGAKYDYKNITFFISPEIKRHRLIGFKEIRHPEYLLRAGVRFGIGYIF